MPQDLRNKIHWVDIYYRCIDIHNSAGVRIINNTPAPIYPSTTRMSDTSNYNNYMTTVMYNMYAKSVLSLSSNVRTYVCIYT